MSDCGLLSCTKIERPSPLEKPFCKVRFFAQNRSRKYRQKVTVATLSPTTSHPNFQLLAQTAHVRFYRRKRVHLGFAQRIAHKGLHAETRVFQMGVVSLPSERFTRFGNPAWPGGRTANFAAFEPWLGALPKNAESLRNSDAHDACRCSEGVAAPLGCVILVRMLIALLGGPVANFPALWYDKFNKLESVMH